LDRFATFRSILRGKLAREPRRAGGVEFLLYGSPTDAFYSQIAFFRLSLDQLGAEGRAARLVAVFAAPECPPVPDRWAPHFERIEVHHVSGDAFHRKQPASDQRFDLLSPDARCSCLCDADTMLVRPLPDEFLDELTRSPAVCGVVAHYPFPVEVDTRRPGVPGGLYPGMPQDAAWNAISEAVLGRPIARPLRYTLLEGAGDDRCPFYVNYGFLAGPPALLRRLYRAMSEIHPVLERTIGGYFVAQISVALAVELAGIPWRALPMRFNFPNDRHADRRYADELDQVVLLHYLRYDRFDRHRIFAQQAWFDHFLSLTLEGSDRVFQERVARMTAGRYPFGGASNAPA
jgi:hypothetical protein